MSGCAITTATCTNNLLTTVTNMSRGLAQAVMDIGVACRESVSEALDIMRAVGAAMRADESLAPLILDDLEIAGVERLDDSAVVLRCRFKVAPLAQWTVRRAFLQRIKEAFDRRGVEIPFPHVTPRPYCFLGRFLSQMATRISA